MTDKADPLDRQVADAANAGELKAAHREECDRYIWIPRLLMEPLPDAESWCFVETNRPCSCGIGDQSVSLPDGPFIARRG